jgi:hypothetical protein
MAYRFSPRGNLIRVTRPVENTNLVFIDFILKHMANTCDMVILLARAGKTV